jgi:hypothetical protein
MKNPFKKQLPSKESLLEGRFHESFGISIKKFADDSDYFASRLIDAIKSAPFNPQKATSSLACCGSNTPENVGKIRALNAWYNGND